MFALFSWLPQAGEISVASPNFRHFTFYRKFGGYTWALIMVWKRRTFDRQWAIMRKQ